MLFAVTNFKGVLTGVNFESQKLLSQTKLDWY